MRDSRHLVSVAIVLAMTVALFVSSCKPSAPSGIIQPDVMEDLLYDYHIADAMARQAKGDYDQNIVSYHMAVLKKYDVTIAEFDSSMIYYMRHASLLHDMYENIADRMGDEANAVGSSVSAGNGDYNTASGDTIDLWKGPNSLVLIPNEPYNLYSFHFKPDGKAQRGDDFVLCLHSNFIYQDGMRDGLVNLSLVYTNDSVATRVMHLSSSGDQQVVLTDGDSLGVKSIRGYFLLNRNNQANGSLTTLQLAAFDKIHLLRCHRKVVATSQNTKSAQLPDTNKLQNQTVRNQGLESPNTSPSNSGVAPVRKIVPNANLKLEVHDKGKLR